jgi:hypothetical protein
MALTRAQALATLVSELAPIADALAAGDDTRGWELIEPLLHKLAERHDGEWKPFEHLVFRVDGNLEPFNYGCMTAAGEVDSPKFARHVVRFTEKLRDQAAKAASSAKSKSTKPKPKKSAKSKPKRTSKSAK